LTIPESVIFGEIYIGRDDSAAVQRGAIESHRPSLSYNPALSIFRDLI
jgi:hypothetical protein